MIRPVRLQLSRLKGFSLQEHSREVNGLYAVNVARPSKWGNPWSIDDAVAFVGCHPEKARRIVVQWYRDWLTGKSGARMENINHSERAGLILAKQLSEIRGRNLACWCKESPCHADVLLELANATAAFISDDELME